MIEPRIEIVLPAKPMTETLRFFLEQLGFHLESIIPADDPAVAVVALGGMKVQLRSDYNGDPGRLQITTDLEKLPATTRAPNGTEIQFVSARRPLVVPRPDDTPVLTIGAGTDSSGTGSSGTGSSGTGSWVTGRAGMLYRDLIPGRMNGHLIASHIRIPNGGPVADDVHFHDVRFQMIYCYRGWVRLVYEDQGEPFVMRAGDCVLQPPQIRHRVLEASQGLEVIEFGCPALHLTTLDHELELPTKEVRPDREFGGQRFQLHQHANAKWRADASTGWQMADLGIAAATKQLADAAVLRANSDATCTEDRLCNLFVLAGSCRITVPGKPTTELQASDCATIPGSVAFTIDNCSDDTQLLRVRL